MHRKPLTLQQSALDSRESLVLMTRLARLIFKSARPSLATEKWVRSSWVLANFSTKNRTLNGVFRDY